MNGSSTLLSHVTVLPDEPKETEPNAPREWTISPSSVALWIECARKWGFRYIAKLVAQAAESAQLGTDGHAQAEAFLGGETSGLDFSRPSGAIMQAGMHLWPAPRTPGMHLERKFRFRSERTGFIYSGLKDIDIEPNVPVPSLGFDGWAPIVIDHKTTSSIEKYAKSTETLLYDAQTTIYGLDSMARYESPVVDLGWIYYQTKGARRAKPVTMRVELAHTLKVFDAVEEVASEMSEARGAFAYASTDQAVAWVKESMKPNPAACGAYGGCPYQHVCNLSPAQRMRSALSMSLISDLKNRVQGVSTNTTTTSATEPASSNDIPEDHPLNKPYQPKSAEGAAAIGVPFTPPSEEPKEDPINPDESKLPPPAPENTTPPPPAAQPESTEPAQPRKPGRPRGSKNKTDDTAAPRVDTSGIQNAQVDGKIVVGEVPERLKVEAKNTPTPFAATKLFLYVDCMPEGVACVNADALVAKANAKIVAGGQVAHYKFLKFGEAAGALAIALNEVLDEEAPAYVFCSSTSDALPTLTTRANMVTRSVR